MTQPFVTLSAHLSFNGDCSEALELYTRLFGGEITFLMRFGDSPMKDQFPVEFHGAILHSTITIGNQSLMCADAPPERYSKPGGTFINLQMPDLAEGKRVFEELSEGGGELMAFGETFWAKGFGMCTDRFGQNWMVNVGDPM